MPPKAGFDVALQRIAPGSVLRVPKLPEKRRNNALIITENNPIKTENIPYSMSSLFVTCQPLQPNESKCINKCIKIKTLNY